MHIDFSTSRSKEGTTERLNNLSTALLCYPISDYFWLRKETKNWVIEDFKKSAALGW